MKLSFFCIRNLSFDCVSSLLLQKCFVVFYHFKKLEFDYFSHPTISRGEKEYIAKCIGPAHSDQSPPVPWSHILTSVPVWALIFTHVAQENAF